MCVHGGGGGGLGVYKGEQQQLGEKLIKKWNNGFT